VNGGVLSEESPLCRELKDLSLKLYEAFEGEGLCRFDIRQDAATGKLLVLDANPNPSTFYKDECTADTIMRLTPDWSKTKFMQFLVEHALERQRKFHAKNAYVVKYSSERGFSLHASRALKAGDMVYSDEEASLRLITRSYAASSWSSKEMQSFDAYAWPVGEGVFAIWDQDSSKWKPINHSCDPNTWMSGLQVRARRDIAAGEELTLDYATFEPEHPAFECWCGAGEGLCRKQVRPDEYREEWFQQRYGEHVSPHILSLQKRERELEQQARKMAMEMFKEWQQQQQNGQINTVPA
jgi:D-alanine-D-alanine ligase